MARTDTASRVIAAPLDRVFAALVDPEALMAWLPPDGMSGRFERFDARPGGSYRLVLTYADASSARGKATVQGAVPAPRKIVLEERLPGRAQVTFRYGFIAWARQNRGRSRGCRSVVATRC